MSADIALVRSAVPVGLSCPEWCNRDHDIDLVDVSGVHRVDIASNRVEVSMVIDQSFGINDGVFVLDRAFATIYASGPGCDTAIEGLDSDQLRYLASTLGSVADRLDQINEVQP